MRREHRRPRIVGSVRLGGSSFVDGGLEYVVWRFAFVSFWFLSVLGGSWHFRDFIEILNGSEQIDSASGSLADRKKSSEPRCVSLVARLRRST